MIETKWTHGPWTACFTRTGGGRGRPLAFEITAQPMGSVEPLVVCPATWAAFQGRSEEFEANAHLIAAAPDLYDALKELKWHCAQLDPAALSNGFHYAIAEATDALAKSSGEAAS